MLASVIAIYLALVFQFKNAVKPFIVFAGIPFGAVGAFASLWIMGMPMGFLAILGITSLIGVIVSHVIVLFDFIEEQHERGAPLQDALIDAGYPPHQAGPHHRRRDGAGVVSVGPARRTAVGGALLCADWRPELATAVTLFLVPVFYSVFVLDLKLVPWSRPDGVQLET